MITLQNGVIGSEPDLEEFEDGGEEDDEDHEDEDHVDGESTDSMVSAAQLATVFAASTPRPAEGNGGGGPETATARGPPYLVNKRVSNVSGAIFYQARPAVNASDDLASTPSAKGGGGRLNGDVIGGGATASGQLIGGLSAQERTPPPPANLL